MKSSQFLEFFLVSTILGAVNARSRRYGERINIPMHADIADFPYVGSMDEIIQDVFWHLCAVSVVSANHVLSAARCIVFDERTQEEFMKDTFIRIRSTTWREGGILHRIQSYVIHPQFNKGDQKDYDIAIIKVDTLILFSPRNAVKLAPVGYEIPRGLMAISVGWHMDYDIVDDTVTGIGSEELKKMTVRIASVIECDQYFSNIKIHSPGHMLCSYTNKNERGGCLGDIGAPLLINGVQVAISTHTHFYEDACEEIEYNSYVLIAPVREWILNVSGV